MITIIKISDQTEPLNSMFDWLAQKSGSNPFTSEEEVVFHLKFSNFAIPLKEKKLSVNDARSLVKSVRNFLKSKTTAIMRSEGYVFDGLLGQTGGGKALLYYVIKSNTFEVFCGKVYCVENETAETITIETDSSRILHSPSKHPLI